MTSFGVQSCAAGGTALSEIRAIFEPGIWKDFSKEHRALREELQLSLASYQTGKFRDPMAVWGAFGAGKTQFLFWVAEQALQSGLIPVYFHLNDLLDGPSEKLSPEGFRDYARAFVARVVEALRSDPGSELLRRTYRDEALLSYVLERLKEVDPSADERPVRRHAGSTVVPLRAGRRSQPSPRLA